MRRFVFAAGLISLGVLLAVLPAVSRPQSQSDASSGYSSSDVTTLPPGTVRTIATGIGAQANLAFSLAADPSGKVYVLVLRPEHTPLPIPDDDTANRVFVIDPNTDSMQPFAGNGSVGPLGDGGPATAAQFNFGTTFFGLEPHVAYIAGAQTSKGSIATGISGISADPSGNICISDTQNATVRCVSGPQSSEPGILRSVAGQWGGASNIPLVAPAALASDANGNLYVADSGSDSVFELHNGNLATIVQTVAQGPIAVNASGTKLFLGSTPGAAGGTVDEVDLGSLSASSLDADINTVAEVSGPSGLAIDSAGNLFISDAGANVIRRLVTTGPHAGQMTVIAGTGVAGNSGDGGPATAAQFNAPGALTIDSKGDLFVADQANHTVREIIQAAAQAASGSVTLSPSGAGFGDQLTGGTSAAQTFTLTNSSSVAATISSISFDGANPSDFAQTTTCGSSVAAGASCSILVTFSPQATGARAAQLQVIDSDPSSPQTAALSGTGTDFEIQGQGGIANPQLTVLLGDVTSFNLQVYVPSGSAFSGSVSLACPAAMPALMTCIINPTSVNVSPGSPQNFMASFATVANVNSPVPNTAAGPFPPTIPGGKEPSNPDDPRLPPVGVCALALAILALVLLPLKRESDVAALQEGLLSLPVEIDTRRWIGTMRVRQWLALALMIGSIAAFVACNNNNGVTPNPSGKSTTSTPTTTPAPTATPTGTYQLQVIGSAQNGGRGVTVTLVVIKQ